MKDNTVMRMIYRDVFPKLSGGRRVNGARFFTFFVSPYSIDLPIYFSPADLDRMSRMFSLVLSPKFYRGRTSIVISLCVRYTFSYTLTYISRSVTSLPLLPYLPLRRLQFRALSVARGSVPPTLPPARIGRDSTHSRAVSYSWPPRQ